MFPYNYQSSGSILIRYNDGLEFITTKRSDIAKTINDYYSNEKGYTKRFREGYLERLFDFPLENMAIINGETFLKGIKDKIYTDKTGILHMIIIDGFLSNLGICDEQLHQGKFLVSLPVFQEIVENKSVHIAWESKEIGDQND